MTFNVENLFDDVSQGSEYPEYDPDSGDWNSDAYLGKLAAVSAAVKKAPVTPDVILFQEVENSGVLKDLADDFLISFSYNFSAAPIAEGSAAQTGVLSRWPVVSLMTHKPGGSEGERNILEIRLDLDDTALIIFNNHWKSRRGGVEETEDARRRSAESLKFRMEELQITEPDTPFILAGDFNEDPWDTDRPYPVALGEYNAALPPVLTVPAVDAGLFGETGDEESLLAGSFWSLCESEGSYWYSGAWERIDSLFWSQHLQNGDGWEVTEAVRVDDSFLLNEYGCPDAFNADTLEGCSDHLPLVIVLEKR